MRGERLRVILYKFKLLTNDSFESRNNPILTQLMTGQPSIRHLEDRSGTSSEGMYRNIQFDEPSHRSQRIRNDEVLLSYGCP